MDTWLHACSWLLQICLNPWLFHLFYSLFIHFLRLACAKSAQKNPNNSPRSAVLSFVLLCTAETDMVQKQMRKLA